MLDAKRKNWWTEELLTRFDILIRLVGMHIEKIKVNNGKDCLTARFPMKR